MKNHYVVNPVEHQPQWEAAPQPIQYQWGRGFLAAGGLALAFIAFLDVLYAAWLLGGGL